MRASLKGMGIDNPVHLLFIAIVALIVLGPRRLPEVARALGHGLREFREAVSQQADQTITQQPGQQTVTQQTMAQEPVTQQPVASQPIAQPGATHDAPAPASAAPAAPDDPDAVDPAESVRSGDAPDRRPL